MINSVALRLQALLELGERFRDFGASMTVEGSIGLERVFQKEGALAELLAQKYDFIGKGGLHRFERSLSLQLIRNIFINYYFL